MSTSQTQSNHVLKTIGNWKDNLNKMEGSSLLLGFSIVILSIALFVWVLYYVPLESRECSNMSDAYGALNGAIQSIDTTDSDYAYALKNYYIKSAYNACSGGSYKNDYVNICILKDLLKQGVRALDFEIYSLNDQPVVSTSTDSSYFIKETFNSVPFSDVMNVLVNYAFSGSTAPRS